MVYLVDDLIAIDGGAPAGDKVVASGHQHTTTATSTGDGD